MPRSLMLTMEHPQETLGMSVPVGRRISAAGKTSWIALLAASMMTLGGLYLYQINAAATKTFVLREREKQLERLREHVSSLEAQSAKLQAIEKLEERVKSAGFVAVDQVEYLNSNRGNVARAK